MAETDARRFSRADVELDFDALAAGTVSDRGEVWLLQWLKTAEEAIVQLDEDDVRSVQPELEKTLLRLVSQPAPPSQAAPKPGRPVRNIVARIFVRLFARAEQRTLFEVISTLLRVGGSDPVKGQGDVKEYRVASFYVAAEILRAHGQHVMSQFADSVLISTKIAKTSSLPPILRYQALLCLNAALIAGGRTLSPTDQLGKDLIKTLRVTLADRTSVVVRGTVDCLLTLAESSELIRTLIDIEAWVTLAIKGLDAADFQTRRSLARLIATLLASTQTAGSAPPPPPPAGAAVKKKKADGADDDGDDPYPSVMTAEEKEKTLLKPMEMLPLLSTPYNRTNTSRKVKSGLVDAYAALFGLLGTGWVEQDYADIFRHIVQEIGVPKPTLTTAAPTTIRHDALMGRKLAGILLRDVIGIHLLTEQGQVFAIREITGSILARWPSLMPGSRPPTKEALVLALDEVAGLLRQLGSATLPIQEVLYDPLLRLLAHPSHSVQIAAALCLRTFCYAAPTRLPNTTSHVLDLVSKDLQQLGQPGAPIDVAKRAVGHAHGLAALMSVIPNRPLYVSLDISAKVMSLAIQLLKQSANHDLHVSAVEIQVAWIIVGALMSLGPNFVRLHLPQLLILWKNALPKPSAKDASASQVRSENEWGFLLHIRESALGALLSFLRYNSDKLMNLDTGRRIAAMLSNGLSFLSDFANRHVQLLQEQQPSTTSQLRLIDRDLLMRRRLLQCFVALGRHPSAEPLHASLLNFSLAIFADPERYTGSAVQAAIAANSGTFVSVWESTDGFSYGVTSLLVDHDIETASVDGSHSSGDDWINRDLTEVAIEGVLRQPSLPADEHDAQIVSRRGTLEAAPQQSPAPATGAVDASVEVFAAFLFAATSASQTSALQQMAACIRSVKLERNPGRRMAILANSVTAILTALRVHVSTGARRQPDNATLKALRDILADALLHPDSRIRCAAAEGLGRLSGMGGSGFMAALVQHCVSQIVNSTDPNCRAGCALAFGQIYGQIGSLQAGPILKTIVDVLMSLSSDPHPLVHFWALRSLSGVISTAGLAYEPYLNGTLGMTLKLYMSDTHEPEGGSQGSVNLRGDLPAYQNLCRILNAIIGVLGPELQASDKVRVLVHTLIMEFAREPGEGIKVEALKSLQHLMLFVIDHIDIPATVASLRKQLVSPRRPLRVAAANTIYQLVQRNAVLMSRLGGDKLVVDLFSMLDVDPTIEGVRAAILSWLRQTADVNPTGWIDLCQRIVSRATAAQAKPIAPGGNPTDANIMDEEAQGFGVEEEAAAKAKPSTSRWRTQLFALQCLHEVFLAVIRTGRREHFDVKIARTRGHSNFKPLMLVRVADIIKMAFTASTASIMEIRLEGLVVLRDVIENFRGSSDLDFDDALLLEQHQAPIAAALTPAFSADSFPEVLASAIQVCAVFVGSGVIKEISKMGRILKLLTGALESCRDSEILSVGDMRDLSSTASVMIKTAVFAAWAEFEVASTQQAYLADVIKPHLALLCTSWVACLREYARLNADTETSNGTGPGAFDSMQASLTREIALPYYTNAWLRIIRATALLVKADDPMMIRAMDGADPASADLVNGQHRQEPTLYWPVLFGLAYEAAATSAAASDDPASAQSMETALLGLEALCQPSVAGNVFAKDAVFDELCNLCYRLAATEAPRSQILVTRVVLQLAKTVGASAKLGTSTAAQVTQCLRVIVQILVNAIPGLSSMAASKARKAPAQHATLINVAFTAYSELAKQDQQLGRDQAFAIGLGLYAQLLKDESSGVDLVGPSLSGLKALLEGAFSGRIGSSDLIQRVAHGLLSGCLQNAEEVRGREGISTALKTSNNVLASVLILTTLPQGIPISRAALEHCCFLIAQLMKSANPETAAVATHCARSLMLTKSHSSPILSVSVGQLLPSLIEAAVAACEAGPEIAPARLGAAQETLRIFSGLVGLADAQHRSQALVIVLPIFLLLLDDASSPLRPAAVSQILQLASLDPAAFRSAVAALEPKQKTLMETALRGSVRPTDIASNRSPGLPTIELKSFG